MPPAARSVLSNPRCRRARSSDSRAPCGRGRGHGGARTDREVLMGVEAVPDKRRERLRSQLVSRCVPSGAWRTGQDAQGPQTARADDPRARPAESACVSISGHARGGCGRWTGPSLLVRSAVSSRCWIARESRQSRRVGRRGCSPQTRALSTRRTEALDLFRRPASGSASARTGAKNRRADKGLAPVESRGRGFSSDPRRP